MPARVDTGHCAQKSTTEGRADRGRPRRVGRYWLPFVHIAILGACCASARAGQAQKPVASGSAFQKGSAPAKSSAEFLQVSGGFATAAELDEDPSDVVLDIRHWPNADHQSAAIQAILSRAFRSVSMQRIAVVIIEGHSIVRIEPGAFDAIGKGRVVSLSLSGNGLTTLETSTFTMLTSLKHLDLDRNRLNRIIPGVFAGLDHVATLGLADNPTLKTLGPGALVGMHRLSSVDVRGCPLSGLSTYVLGPAQKAYYSPQLQTVRFTDSLLLRGCMVDAAGFAGCRGCAAEGSAVEEHAVQVACIQKGSHTVVMNPAITPTTVPSPSNAGSASLLDTAADSVASLDVMPQDHIVLVPSYGETGAPANPGGRHRSRRDVSVLPPPITTITSATFAGLSTQDITVLIIEGQQISSVTPGAFANVGTGVVLELVLYNNGITFLATGVFTGLFLLEGLDLGGNPIESLQSGVFSGLTGLINLGLVNANPLSVLPSTVFTHLQALSTVSLIHTRISVIFKDIFGTRSPGSGVVVEGSGNLGACTYTAASGVICNACYCPGFQPVDNLTANVCSEDVTTTTPGLTTGVGSTTTTTIPTVCRTSGWAFKFQNTDSCGRSLLDGACHSRNASFAEAVALCAGANGRLCTVAELQADVARGTGCSLDNRTVWSGDACGPQSVFRLHGADVIPFTPECVATNDSRLESVRCCASSTDLI
eukprot:m.445123 g.445123  ORF g.445123 m.445123 type:complete len:707 (-) comp19189_c0_seq1:48-2168(-)